MDDFKLWSETNPEILKMLRPDLGLRGWRQITNDEKIKIWQILENKKWFTPNVVIYNAIQNLNEKYKYHSYGIDTFNHGGPHYDGTNNIAECCKNKSFNDFRTAMFLPISGLWYETLTLYSRLLIKYPPELFVELGRILKKDEELKTDYSEFDRFALDFNDVCEHFGINILLTRSGLIPKQEEKITEQIYKPTIIVLSDKKWISVNQELEVAFKNFLLGTQEAYSATITHGVNTIQAFLQIVVNGETGKGDISKLIPQAQSNGLIPDDLFTIKIFKDLESFFMAERQETGNAHPKKEFATEKNARLLLNLVMVFLQHCIQGSQEG